MTPERVLHRHGRKCRQGVAALNQRERLLNVKAPGIHGESMPPGGDARERKRQAVLAFQQRLFAQQQADQGPGDIAKADKCQFVLHEFS